VVKGESTDYAFRLSNEDFISYQSLRVKFFSDTSRVDGTEEVMNYCLLPGENVSMDTQLHCFYRGVFSVGARSIEVTDLFGIFRLAYRVRSRGTITVLPRRVKLSALSILTTNEDSKDVLFHPRAKQEEPDIEMRPYLAGDSARMIHWKASARRGELMSRRFTENMRLGVMLCMDLSPTGIHDMLPRAEVEDKIIESAIAIGDYCLAQRIPCDIYYDDEGLKKASAGTVADMEAFYNECGHLQFNSELDAGGLISNSMEREIGSYRYLVITHELTGELYSTASAAISRGNEVTVVLMRDTLSEHEQNIRAYMGEASIPVVQIEGDRDFKDVFEGNLREGL
jgi:hypothetical protein